MKKIIYFLFVVFITCECFASGNELSDMLSEVLTDKLELDSDVTAVVNIDSKDSKKSLTKINLNNISNIAIISLDDDKKSFTAELIDNNKQKDLISGRYELYTKILSATDLIRRGDVVAQNNTTLVSVVNGSVSKYNPSLLYGMQSRKNIFKGSIIREYDLVHPILIKERDVVDIIYNAGNVYLKTKGIALQRGAFGDYIRVKNEKSGIILSAKVIEKKTVEVKPNDQK